MLGHSVEYGRHEPYLLHGARSLYALKTFVEIRTNASPYIFLFVYAYIDFRPSTTTASSTPATSVGRLRDSFDGNVAQAFL